MNRAIVVGIDRLLDAPLSGIDAPGLISVTAPVWSRSRDFCARVTGHGLRRLSFWPGRLIGHNLQKAIRGRELYCLPTGAADGKVNAISLIALAKFDEVQSSCQ